MMLQGTKPGPGKVQALSFSLFEGSGRCQHAAFPLLLGAALLKHHVRREAGFCFCDPVTVHAVNLHFTCFFISDDMLINHFVNSWGLLGKTLKSNKNNWEKILIKYEAIFENSKLKY